MGDIYKPASSDYLGLFSQQQVKSFSFFFFLASLVREQGLVCCRLTLDPSIAPASSRRVRKRTPAADYVRCNLVAGHAGWG